jgi:hypothetical protein
LEERKKRAQAIDVESWIHDLFMTLMIVSWEKESAKYKCRQKLDEPTAQKIPRPIIRRMAWVVSGLLG